MNIELKIYIDKYLEKVEEMCNILLKHYNVRCKSELMKILFASNKNKQISVDNILFFVHGKGCYAASGNIKINWDFGYRGRWCGIDPYFVADYIRDNVEYKGEYTDGKRIKKELDEWVKDEEAFIKNGMYYYSQNMKNVFCPQFPREFDTILVSHFEEKWELQNSKELQRFIRKAIWVDKDVDKNPDRYILKFKKEGKIIYEISYDDIGYPESAIKIMNDVIIKNMMSVIKR